jgi:hypothetical protein
MLTKEYIKDHFIDAYFVDEERENIEILQTSEDKKSVFPTVIPFEKEHGQFQVLESVMSVDELHERTYQKKKEERKLFEEQLVRIAKKDGILMSGDSMQKELFPTVVSAIVNNPDNEDHLFALKLALFEVDKIRDSEDTELKSAIRKSKTKAEVLFNALKIILA